MSSIRHAPGSAIPPHLARTSGTEPADRSGGEHGDQRGVPASSAIWMVAGMAAFGSATPVSKLVGSAFGTWTGSALRMAVALVAVLGVTAVSGTRSLRRSWDALRRTSPADRVRLGALALIGTFGFTVLMVLGMQRAPGAVAAVVMGTTPAVTAVGAVLFLHEPLGRRRLIAIALAVAGVVLVELTAGSMSSGGGSAAIIGSVLIFGAVCCEACYTLIGKRLSAGLDPVELTGVAAGGAFLAALPLMAWEVARAGAPATSGGDWAALLWWGAGTMTLGSLCWFTGMRRVRSTTSAAFMAVMPASALLLSYLLLGESFRWEHVAGISLVVAGLLVAARPGSDDH